MLQSLSTPITTVRRAMLHLLRAVATSCAPRPLRDAGAQEASPAPGPGYMGDHSPGPATAPDPAPAPLPAAAQDYIQEPPPTPVCQPPAPGYNWMASHHWQHAGPALQCQDCGERWPRPRGEAEA